MTGIPNLDRPPDIGVSSARPAGGAGRDLAIDALRGIAIVLMVAGHVVGGSGREGMMVADDSPWRLGYLLLADLRIPLFTALSGFVYGRRPLSGPDRLAGFARGKVKRLMFPLVTVGTLFVVVQALAPGTNADSDLTRWWTIYFTGQWHFWFLQAIFILLLAAGIANSLGALRSRGSIAAAVAVTAILSAAVRVPAPYDVFSINGAIRLAPFFLLGYAFAVLRPEPGRWRWILLALSAALFVARGAQIISGTRLPPLADAALGLLLGLTGIAALVAFRRALAWPPLARLGYFSFAIYLLHVFGTAATRILLTRLGVEADLLVFPLCLAAGLALPILFEITLGRIAWISWSFLGQKPYRGVPPGVR